MKGSKVAKRPGKLALPVSFEDAVSALLRTPPPPKDALPERPKARKAAKRTGVKRKAATKKAAKKP